MSEQNRHIWYRSWDQSQWFPYFFIIIASAISVAGVLYLLNINDKAIVAAIAILVGIVIAARTKFIK